MMKHPMYLTPVDVLAPSQAVGEKGVGEKGVGETKSVEKKKRKYVRIEPYIRTGTDEHLDGIFLRRDVLEELGFSDALGERETLYGMLKHYGPVYMHLYTRHVKIPRCYELPDAFAAEEKYRGGIVGIQHLWSCGLAVIVESGEIFLQDSDATEFQAKGEFGFN